MAYQQKEKNLAPLDPDVKLPAAVRAAALKATGLHEQVYETPKPEAKQEPNGEERKPEETKPAPTPEAAKVEPEKTPTPVPAATGGENFEHMYNSLKGRYDKQDDTIRQLNHELGMMRQQMEQLRSSAAAQPARTAENTFKKLTDEEREAYGSDFIDVSARAAEEKLLPEIERLKAQLAELGGKVDNTASMTHTEKQQRMYDHLDSKLPDWRKINRDPKFIAWANLRDPFSGAIRITMMNEAHNSYDAARVLNFFQGFLRDEAIVDPASTTKQDVTSEGKVSLESLAAPGRAKAPAASVTPGEKETISRAQIANFYRLVQQGHYRGQEAEKNRLEQMIFDAEREGRVV